MTVEELKEAILGILKESVNGMTQDQIREAKVTKEHGEELSRKLEDFPWTIRDLNVALGSLRAEKKIVLFRPSKGRRPASNNGRIHYILREFAANVGANPDDVGDFQIARTK